MSAYPVSAQYAPLAGSAMMNFGRIVKLHELPPSTAIVRKVYDIPIQDQILSVIRMIDGPNLKQIKYACSKVDAQVVSSEVSRMAKRGVITAKGANKLSRYYENKIAV
jgi:hypothetical protein